jgi:hypothetical protein
MANRRSADLPLHGGAAPAWLFRRMVDLAGAIGTLIVRDFGPEELLRRLSDPFWFQAFGCVLGFDWHSSGVTTTVCGALKEAVKKVGPDLGIVVCGGKGATSRRTPDDIRKACEKSGDDADSLVRISKLSAKVDNSAVQDGYQLYHHCFFLIPGRAKWAVVQQGMNEQNKYARRYHWLSEAMPSFVSDPHAAIACDRKETTLNLVAGEGEAHRHAMTKLLGENPEAILREVQPLLRESPMPLFDLSNPDFKMPRRHSIATADLEPAAVRKVLLKTYECQATDFESLLGESGIGAQALRSLSLIAETIWNAPASRRDPAAYSFAHGGKDGHPYVVNRKLYDENIDRLQSAICAAKIGRTDKVQSLKSLVQFIARLSN